MAEAYICSLSKVQRHAEICKEINRLYEQKNHDYPDGFDSEKSIHRKEYENA